MYYNRLWEEVLTQQTPAIFYIPGWEQSSGWQLENTGFSDGSWTSEPPEFQLSEGGMSDEALFTIAMAKTGKAGMQGALIAMIDGPIPIMDIVGFAWASYKTAEAWQEYREATS